MTHPVISVDVMGGDHGPDVTLKGIEKALVSRPDARFMLFGDQQIVQPALSQRPIVNNASTFVHCDMSIAMDAKPSVALRQGRKVSSMWQAVEAVKSGAAQACISAGNTGALMAMSKVILRTLPGIERPAICAVWPTVRGRSVVLDVGATIGGPAAQYAQFAVMGAAYARTLFGLPNPTIGLLNIGVEDVKGTDSVREAAELLSRSELNFTGFIEGDGIGRGDADVIVTDGFTGNIALKTAEGTSRQISAYLRQAVTSSMFARLGYVFARPAFKALRARMDPNAANGGMFLGLNGIVVKSHGGADASGFASAVSVAIEVADANISKTIAADIEKMQILLDDAWAQTLD
ncbi:MAG: phosphate acyltransferase PlsX [PS1 clade bacterium]|nr:phosphate acyltransferase PlsX [PS1 clade bacterium]